MQQLRVRYPQAISSGNENRPTSGTVRRWLAEAVAQAEAAWQVGHGT
jgi:hypothetical protein